jgi:IS5 family transposase
VICANVAYPTDSGLLAKAVGKLVRTARRVRAAGGAPATAMTDRRPSSSGTKPRSPTTTTASSSTTTSNTAPLPTARNLRPPSSGSTAAPAARRAVTADRGYGRAAFERDLHDLGVRTVAIPRQGKISAARSKLEHSRSFHRLVKWRTGCEGRISYLKRGYGSDRTRLDTRHGAAIWCGHGVFAHNLVKIAALAS